ncbi:hypothetical protein [Gordonia zhaorongruii]|uniref:hypothetical protein n=1 Tax=Gordonia zhaorongruii TaxID=2597659 RepID=UPI001045BE6F|nr:hypothetical protein [Gordonia zhaorongruii]
MRKKQALTAGAAIAVVAVLAVCLSGVLKPSVDGTPVPNETMQALNGLNDASTSLADAPAARYDGLVSDDDGDKLEVNDLTVSAMGDVYGKFSRDRGRGEVLQIDGRTLIKADSGFWSGLSQGKRPAGLRMEGIPSDKWVVTDESVLGVDLGAVLRPDKLGLSLNQQDRRLDRTDIEGSVVDAGRDTPDRRASTGRDPAGVSEVEVEDHDGGVDGTQRFKSDEMTVGADDNGDITGIRGPLSVGVAGDSDELTADLRVAPLDAASARQMYVSIKSVTRTAKVGSWNIDVGTPSGGLDCTPGGRCTVTYTLRNKAEGLERGTVDISLNADFKANGRDLGKCDAKGTMPINGSGKVSCGVPLGISGSFNANSNSRFTVSVNGELDSAAIAESAEVGIKFSEKAKGWEATAPKASETARRYNRQITLVPSGYVYRTGDVAFNGREKDGTLLLVYGPGYDAHVARDGAFDPEWAGTEQMVEQVKKAHAAAGGTNVRMVFAEAEAADAARELLTANGVTGVEVVVVPLA